MKKKVLFLIESFIVGGAERVLLNLVNAMDKTKFDVTVISVFKRVFMMDMMQSSTKLFRKMCIISI